MANLTSITTLVTPYIDVRVTNYETHVYSTNTSTVATVDVGYDPTGLLINRAPYVEPVSKRILSPKSSLSQA